MTDYPWRPFLLIAARHLYRGQKVSHLWPTCCMFTTFNRLRNDPYYWKYALPVEGDLLETTVRDGGAWHCPFNYDDIAHLFIPRRYMVEQAPGPDWGIEEYEQDIDGLSAKLTEAGLEHRLTELVLEVKLY